MIRAAAFLIASLALASILQSADGKDAAKTEAGPGVVEKMLIGCWDGPACGGTYTFKADGTYVLANWSPGGYTLTGTWKLRWDGLPPTLVIACKTSTEEKHAGNTWELKLVKLDDKAFTYEWPVPAGTAKAGEGAAKGSPQTYERATEKKKEDREERSKTGQVQ